MKKRILLAVCAVGAVVALQAQSPAHDALKREIAELRKKPAVCRMAVKNSTAATAHSAPSATTRRRVHGSSPGAATVNRVGLTPAQMEMP